MCTHLNCQGCQCPNGRPPCSHCVEDHDNIDNNPYATFHLRIDQDFHRVPAEIFDHIKWDNREWVVVDGFYMAKHSNIIRNHDKRFFHHHNDTYIIDLAAWEEIGRALETATAPLHNMNRGGDWDDVQLGDLVNYDNTIWIAISDEEFEQNRSSYTKHHFLSMIDNTHLVLLDEYKASWKKRTTLAAFNSEKAKAHDDSLRAIMFNDTEAYKVDINHGSSIRITSPQDLVGKTLTVNLKRTGPYIGDPADIPIGPDTDPLTGEEIYDWRSLDMLYRTKSGRYLSRAKLSEYNYPILAKPIHPINGRSADLIIMDDICVDDPYFKRPVAEHHLDFTQGHTTLSGPLVDRRALETIAAALQTTATHQRNQSLHHAVKALTSPRQTRAAHLHEVPPLDPDTA